MAISAATRQKVYQKYDNACAFCLRCRDLEVHHREIKGMGGRQNEEKAYSDSVENLILLCRVCHGAMHGEHVITIDGFSCAVCPCSWACEFTLVESPLYSPATDPETLAERMVGRL
jgi:hypothetical protein